MQPVLYIEPSLCHTCETCRARRACKPRAILQLERGELPAVDATRCLACQACISACPFGAVLRTGAPMALAHP